MPKKLTQEEFIHRAREVHGERYDYCETVYQNARTKVKIICPGHGAFYQKAGDHLSGRGCPKCAAARGHSNFNQAESFSERASLVHNGKYSYMLTEYKTNKDPVKIICPEHGEFWQRAADHLRGKGCPKCGIERTHRKDVLKKIHETKKHNQTYGKSLEEDKLYEKLLRKFGSTDVKRQLRDERYPFACDFYIKSLDLFIEYNGFWTHGGHWYDENNPEDKKELEVWKEKNTPYYEMAIKVWTESDVLKRETARKNNIGYVALWNEQDANEWFDAGCPVRYDFL